MGKQTTPNFRGKGCSETKFTKAGEPKHAGNWSASKIHYQSLQVRDYYVRYVTDKGNGIQKLIVGDHTPLAELMGTQVEWLAMRDENFDTYTQSGYNSKIVPGKKYEAYRRLCKSKLISSWEINPHAFTYREAIYTEGDFEYYFPEY